jgi:hypothetical protein
VALYSDSLIVKDDERIFCGSKVYQRGEVLYGLSGDIDACNVVQYDVVYPMSVGPRTLGEFAHEFSTRCILALEDADFGDDSPTVEVLIGTRIGLAWCDGIGSSTAIVGSYYAIGSGAKYALGMLAASNDLLDPYRVIDTVATLDPSVGGPVYMEEIVG